LRRAGFRLGPPHPLLEVALWPGYALRAPAVWRLGPGASTEGHAGEFFLETLALLRIAAARQAVGEIEEAFFFPFPDVEPGLDLNSFKRRRLALLSGFAPDFSLAPIKFRCESEGAVWKSAQNPL